jgi:hypothetical protein
MRILIQIHTQGVSQNLFYIHLYVKYKNTYLPISLTMIALMADTHPTRNVSTTRITKSG